MAHVLIAGAGYSGRPLADALKSNGHTVTALARSGHPNVQIYDLDSPNPAVALPAVERVVFLAPPAEGDPEPRLCRLLDALPEPPERLVLASTSGVYGDCEGRLIDESEPVKPTSDRARRRVIQERTALHANVGRRIVLRISGIYGPGRLPLERLAAGDQVIHENEAHPGNRIHVDDLVRVLLAATEHPDADGIYNVADGNFISGTGFYQRVATLAGLPQPQQISRAEAQQTFSPMRYSFLSDARKLDTRRLTDELGVELAYRDLDAGIQASLAS